MKYLIRYTGYDLASPQNIYWNFLSKNWFPFGYGSVFYCVEAARSSAYEGNVMDYQIVTEDQAVVSEVMES